MCTLITQDTASKFSAFSTCITRKFITTLATCVRKRHIKATKILKRMRKNSVYSLKCVYSLLLWIIQLWSHAVASVWSGEGTAASLFVFWIWGKKLLMSHVLFNCSSISQNINQIRALNLQAGSRESYERLNWCPNTPQQSFGLKQIPRGNRHVQNPSESRLTHLRLIAVLTGKFQALSVEKEY